VHAAVGLFLFLLLKYKDLQRCKRKNGAPFLSHLLPDPIRWMNRHEAQEYLLRPPELGSLPEVFGDLQLARQSRCFGWINTRIGNEQG
jgi:hypothetical protein